MKKVKITELQEILAIHFTSGQDYVEQALTVFMNDFMDVSSGVITGLAVTQIASSGTISVASGHIFQDGVFGTLESPSGITLSLPVSGTRTDLLVGSYFEAEDTVVSGYLLMDVSSAIEVVEELPSRRIGAIEIEQLISTSYSSRPSNAVPIAEIVLTSSGISSITDLRLYSRIQRLQVDLQTDFYNLFYSSI